MNWLLKFYHKAAKKGQCLVPILNFIIASANYGLLAVNNPVRGRIESFQFWHFCKTEQMINSWYLPISGVCFCDEIPSSFKLLLCWVQCSSEKNLFSKWFLGNLQPPGLKDYLYIGLVALSLNQSMRVTSWWVWPSRDTSHGSTPVIPCSPNTEAMGTENE